MRRLERLLALLGHTCAERLVTILIILAALTARLVPGTRMIDDAFITFRYARNVVHGAGFVYNAGERVLGTTTPFYTLLMAGLSFVTRSENYPLLALVTNALADAASVFLLYHLGRRLSHSSLVGWTVALLWAIAPMSVTFAIGGMETSVFILLMLGAFTAHLQRRTALSAALAALAFLTRPDAVLIVGLVFAQLMLESLQRQTSTIKTLVTWALVFVLVAAPWFIFATFYFGSPIPESVAAKSAAYHLPPEAALVRFIQHLSVPFFESERLDVGGLIRLVIYLTLYLAAILGAVRREPRSVPLLAYPLVYAAVFAIGNPLIFRWYLAPPLPGYMLAVLVQISNFKFQIPNIQSRMTHLKLETWHLILAPLALIFLFTSARAWTLHPDHGPDRPAPQMAYIELELLYHRVAADLKPQINADTVIAAGDIGALGYDTGARILDTLGLISPQTLGYYPLDPGLYVINYAMPPQLIFDQHPDWIVSPEVYIRNGLLKDTRLQTQYDLYETIPTDIYGSQGLLVFRRK
jgi:arabinofuranosyltransferase